MSHITQEEKRMPQQFYETPTCDHFYSGVTYTGTVLHVCTSFGKRAREVDDSFTSLEFEEHGSAMRSLSFIHLDKSWGGNVLDYFF